jgi:hypothetical protein
VYNTYHIRNCVHNKRHQKYSTVTILKKADIINARRKKEKEIFKYCIIKKCWRKDVKLSETGRGGVRERQKNKNRKQDKEDRHKESNDGCRWIRGRIDGILREDAWDIYCTVQQKKSSVKTGGQELAGDEA